jgi:hypothetical protein
MKNIRKPGLILATVLILLSGFLVMAFTGTVQSSSSPANAQAAFQGLAPDLMGWSDFYYIFAAGSTLRPRDSIQDWANSSDGGCIYATTSANEVMNLHLDLPTGSRIDYLRIFYYDANASNSDAWITTYNGSGGFSDIFSVSTSGASGYGTNLSSYVGHIVDNANNAYVLNWRPNATGSTMRLCGLRVAYRVPTMIIFLPLVRH